MFGINIKSAPFALPLPTVVGVAAEIIKQHFLQGGCNEQNFKLEGKNDIHPSKDKPSQKLDRAKKNSRRQRNGTGSLLPFLREGNS
ncbi:MAG: hypothetical protein KDC80_01275 [Saprospiraceae bacterium]|nr:hypothetical protein [Saprospiraceae bacterium]